MTKPVFSRAVFLPYLTLVIGAAACSPAVSDPIGERGTDAAQRFSADDRRAAQALSIGNEAALQSAETPYDRALLCSYAMNTLATQLRERAVLDGEQMRALGEAESFFDQQIRQLADGRSRAQIAADREEVVEANPEETRGVQIAIGCLRQLQ